MPAATAERVKPNASLLRKTLRRVEENPREWNQANWRCHSGMCYAGHAVTIRGGEWVTGPKHVHSDMLVPTPGEIRASGKLIGWRGPCSSIEPIYENGPVVFFQYRGRWTPGVRAHDRAERLLRLSNEQSGELFDGGNTLPGLQRIVSKLIAEAETP